MLCLWCPTFGCMPVNHTFTWLLLRGRVNIPHIQFVACRLLRLNRICANGLALFFGKKTHVIFFLNHDKISAKTSETIRPIASIIQLMDFDSLKQAAKIYRNCTRNHSGIAHLLSRDKSFLFPTTLHNTHRSSRVLITTSCLHLSCLV